MSRLRMKQLQLLIAIDDLKSLHKASSALAMTQSAASKVLADLESIFEVSLFERGRHGLTPNQFGHCVIRYARLLATDLAAMSDEVSQIRSGEGGRLAIGTIMGAIPEVIAPVVSEMHKAHSRLTIEIVEDTSARMLHLLDDGRVDLLVGRASVSDEPSRYQYETLGDEPLSVVVAYEHPAGSGDGASFTDLDGCRWITFPSHMPMNVALERELDLSGMPMPVNTISTASTFVTVSLLQQNKGLVSILPTDVARMFERHKMLRILPIKLKFRSYSFGLVTRKGGVLSPAAQKFARLIREQTVLARKAVPAKDS